ncbi:MAG: hypothetical protein WB681_08055 [Candidatus Cybelea sp.]
MIQRKLTRYWIAVMIVAALAACAKLDLGGGGNGPIPTPTSSSTTSPTPGVCGTPTSNANLVVVAMGNNIGATSDPNYNTINGYTVVEAGSFSSQAMLIDKWLSQGVLAPITSKNVIQFTNVDSGGALHSAVGFKGDSFPKAPYTFPTAAASPTATAVSTSKLWSTGRIEAPVSQQCYSQTFTLSPGIYYFGDLDYYNLSNFRDVLIVATPSANARHSGRR